MANEFAQPISKLYVMALVTEEIQNYINNLPEKAKTILLPLIKQTEKLIRATSKNMTRAAISDSLSSLGTLHQYLRSFHDKLIDVFKESPEKHQPGFIYYKRLIELETKLIEQWNALIDLTIVALETARKEPKNSLLARYLEQQMASLSGLRMS